MVTNNDVQLFTEAEIIDRIIEGEKSLLEILIRRYNPHLYKIGRSYGYNHQDVQDLMQDTFIICYKHLHQLENRLSFKYWLMKIMLNECNQRKRKLLHQRGFVTDWFNGQNFPPFSSEKDQHMQHMIDGRELNALVEKSLNSIPLRYRLVFTLRELNGFSVEETAKALDITSINVRVRLNRSKALLRKEIEKLYSPEDIFSFNLVYCDEVVKQVMGRVMGG